MNIKRSRFINTQLIFLLSLTLSLAVASGSFAPKKQLTITNRSVMPLRVYVDSDFNSSPTSSIGFVDPGERITFSYPLKLGRWYVKIRPYAPETYVKTLKFTLYVKQDKNSYVYEIHNSDFSDSLIPTPPNVSIIGTWANRSGLATEFRKVGDDEYIGTLVAVPDSMTRFGLYTGLEWITLRRTNFDIYKGTRIATDKGGKEVPFSCQVEKGNELFPHNWFKQ